MNMKKSLALLVLGFGLCQAHADPFPVEKLNGVWRMSQIYLSRTVISSAGFTSEITNRVAITLAFLGDSKCRMTTTQMISKQMPANVRPSIYRYEYSDGVLAFTEVVGVPLRGVTMDQMVPCLNSSRFMLEKKNDDSFVLKYVDLSSFDKFYAFLGNQTSEYLSDGSLKVRKIPSFIKGVDEVCTEIIPPMIFRRVKGMTTESSINEGAPLYKVLSCQKDNGSGISYRFRLELLDKYSNKLDMYRMVQREFRTAMLEEAAQSFTGDSSTLFVEFPKFKLTDCIIEGTAVALPMVVQSLAYNPVTRTGQMSVSLKANQFDVARRYVRKNIEVLAINSNIMITEGNRPPPGRFYIGREAVKDGNVLEIEFRTE